MYTFRNYTMTIIVQVQPNTIPNIIEDFLINKLKIQYILYDLLYLHKNVDTTYF